MQPQPPSLYPRILHLPSRLCERVAVARHGPQLPAQLLDEAAQCQGLDASVFASSKRLPGA